MIYREGNLDDPKRAFLEARKRTIEKELKFDVEESDKLIEEYRKKLSKLKVPAEAMNVIDEEMVYSCCKCAFSFCHAHLIVWGIEQALFTRAIVF